MAGTGCRRCRASTTDDAESARFAWLFPSVAVNALPNHTFLLLTGRLGPGPRARPRTCSCHPESTPSREADAAVDELLAFWDPVNREDIAIVERVQQGLARPAYTGGRMCYRFEEPVHRFQNMVIDRMLGMRRVPEGDPSH